MSGWASFGVSIVQGEVSLLLSATRRGSRWSNHGRNEEDQDPLILGLYRLQNTLNHTPALGTLDVAAFIRPFCQIVQSDDTTGPVTGMAIASLEKFLAYNLIDPAHPSAPGAVESLSEAVTHARFVGTNPASDEVVLMKILQVLRTLLLSPVGRLLTNESVCEIMQSCFRICFEMRLSELLRCFGESTLVDLVQLLFSRLSSFPEDPQDRDSTSAMDQTLMTPQQETPPPVDTSDPAESAEQSDEGAESQDAAAEVVNQTLEEEGGEPAEAAPKEKEKVLTPYGLPCVRELLRFLVSIISSEDGQTNSDSLVAIGLNLITVVLECGSAHLCSYQGLAALVQDSLCKYLFQLLRHDSLTLFSRALRCCCLLFQSCRQYLKLQLEVFINRLMELITLDGSSKSLYDRKELALECVVQFCNTSYFPAELFVNFDCGLYCTSVFENLTKMLSKNAFPTQGAIFSTHLLSLDALLAIANNLETDSHVRLEDGRVLRQASTSTQIESAGIIFSSQLIGDDLAQTPPMNSTSLPDMASLSRSQDMLETVSTSHGRHEGIAKPASGYQTGVEVTGAGREERRVSRGTQAPSSKDLLAIRQKKKLILAATDQFNKKPKQGIGFLMEQGILASPLDPDQAADFLLENPGLSKAKIGDYLGDRKNAKVLESFVSKQSLSGVQMVNAVRNLLESFRLPGEAPVVERILEAFSRHWLDSNQDPGGLGEVFANRDAVHVLCYAIMMLNTDLHSNQVKKKMTLREFIRNQRKTNNGSNFPEQFLTEVYSSIKNEEIIMPDEHSGLVRDNYHWKVLLHRSGGPEGEFMGVADGEFDQDLFLLSWGPTIAALSYVYDHADDKTIAQKAIAGFSKCASVAAHYELKEVFDNLIISLCKFTSLLNTQENSSSLYFQLGVNPKVRQSVHTIFSLAHSYGNILREGWKDLLDCLLALFKARLLPQQMVEVFDFLHPEGKVSLFRDETPVRSDSSLLSSLYSYWSSSQETGSSPTTTSGTGGGGAGGRGLSTSEGKARSAALACIEDCNPEQLFTESKFLRSDALLELVKALVFASRGPDHHHSLGTHFDQDTAVFFMKLLVTVAIENKDRVSLFFQDLSSHLSRVIASATHSHFLLERAVVSVLHLALRLLGRRDFPVMLVLSSLHTILSLPAPSKSSVGTLYCQIAHGITELVHIHSNALSSAQHWLIVFTVLEFAGTGIANVVPSSSNVVPVVPSSSIASSVPSDKPSATKGGSCNPDDQPDWIARSLRFELLWRPEVDPMQFEVVEIVNCFDCLEGLTLPFHEPQAFFKVCECLSFLVRSEHLVTACNFSACLRCTRHFTEVASSRAALDYDRLHTRAKSPGNKREKASSPTRVDKLPRGEGGGAKLGAGGKGDSTTYASALLQLLDLLDALYSKVGRIFDAQTLDSLKESMEAASQDGVAQNGGGLGQEGYCPDVDGENAHSEVVVCPKLGEGMLMWNMAWCPLLQGMAHLCCDSRRSVRQTSITYLQRALLSHDLHNLSGQDWHACFAEVFFPMLTRLMGDIQTGDRVNLEETRVRASNLLCKVFLQHLPSLCQSKDSFAKLWMTILHFMDKFLHLDNSDLLYEAIPESLKNMLLVMTTQGVFENFTLGGAQALKSPSTRSSHHKKLWTDTWNRIDKFLPNFLSELFPSERAPSRNSGSGTPEVGGTDSLPPDGKSGQDIQPPPGEEVSKSASPGVAERERSQSPGGSSGHTSPLRTSPVHMSSNAELETNPAFPVMLHPPLPPDPTLSQPRASPDPPSQNHSTESKPPDEPSPVPGGYAATNPVSAQPIQAGLDSVPDSASPKTVPFSTAASSSSVSSLGMGPNEHITGLAPILGPPAPPYSSSGDSDLGAEGSSSKLIPVPFSSVYSL